MNKIIKILTTILISLIIVSAHAASDTSLSNNAFGAMLQQTTPNIESPASTPMAPTTIKNSSSRETLDKIAAIVNDDVIMESELAQKIFLAKQQMLQNHALMPSDTMLRKEILDNIIDMDLVLQVAKHSGLDIDPKDLDKAIEDIASRNHTNVMDLRKNLELQGIKYDDFRNQIRDQMLAARVTQQALARSIIISDQEIFAYLEKHDPKNVNSLSAKKAAQEAIFRSKIESAQKKWIEDLRKSAYIKIL